MRTMHTKINNIEIMKGNEADEIIEKLVEFFLQKCQKGLEESIKWSKFVFDTDHLLHCKFLKVNLNRSGSRIDFLLNGEKAIKQ